MGKSIQVPSNAQDILATLRRWNLIQDNSGPFRTYYNAQNPDERFHSVTHILSQTQDQSGLERWRARIGHEAADMERDVAATRGTEAKVSQQQRGCGELAGSDRSFDAAKPHVLDARHHFVLFLLPILLVPSLHS